MINMVETLPGAAAAESGGSADVVSASGATAPAGADSVLPGQAGLVASAYLPYALLSRAGIGSMRETAAKSDGSAATTEQTKSAVALIRAALPSTLQQQFDAQLSAALNSGGQAAGAPEHGAMSWTSDLATLVGGNATGDDAKASMLVSRLAHAVAHDGSAEVAAAMHLTGERLVSAFGGDPPVKPPADTRIKRREDEREREQQRRALQYKPQDPDKPAATAAEPGAAFTINDVICYGDATVATRSTPLSSIVDERNMI